MDVLETDFWTMQLPNEWFAEQDDETIIISDEAQVSTIEITPVLVDKNTSKEDILTDMVAKDAFQTSCVVLSASCSLFISERLCVCLVVVQSGLRA